VSGSGKSSRDFEPTIAIPQAGQSLGYGGEGRGSFVMAPALLI
jgi:hypothetical protein